MKTLDFAGSQIKWIAFDAVGTLIYPAVSVAETYHKIGRQFGTKRSMEDVASRFARAFQRSEANLSKGLYRTTSVGVADQRDCPQWLVSEPDPLPDQSSQDHMADFEVGSNQKHLENEDSLSTNETKEIVRWRQIVTDVFDDIVDIEDCFQVLFDHYAKPKSWRCFDDVLPTIEKLIERGIHLSVASNFDRRLHTVFDAFDALARIECRFVSSEVGFRKPSRHFYELICRKCDVSPANVLMVGDDLDHDLNGPRSIGMPSLLVRRKAPKAGKSLGVLGDSDVIDSLTKLIDIVNH